MIAQTSDLLGTEGCVNLVRFCLYGALSVRLAVRQVAAEAT
jgi:hypothetical protein